VGAVLLADYLPSIALGSWFGALADRYPKRRVLVVASLLQAGAYGGLAMAHSAFPILALALVAGTGTALERPAVRAALPVLAGEASQVAAAMYDTVRWAGMTAGPLVAAALFAVSGTALPLALNGASFAVAAVVLATVAIPPAEPHGEAKPAGASIRAGLATALTMPAIAIVAASSAGTFVAGGLLNVCEPLFARRVLHGSSSEYALLVSAYCGGLVVASLLVARRGAKPPNVLIGRYLAAVLLTAAGMFGSALANSLLLAGLTFAATGIGNSLLLVSGTQLIIDCVPNSVQGRVFGAKDTVEGACFLLGLVGAGGLIAMVGVRVTLGTAGAICACCGVAAAAALRTRRLIDQAAPSVSTPSEPQSG
jgi:MFS family permease